jgi:archaellum biogenesis protein FlaJ (TadC family)
MFLAEQLAKPWFWVAILVGILIAPAAARRRERFVFLVTAIQLVFYVTAYLATPNDLRWHVLSSWSRLTTHIAVPIAFTVFLMLANSLRGGQDAPHAEARSDE